jgi:hypothetical protein
LLHEIGHVFGLDHSSNPHSIMSPLFRFDSAEIQSEDVRNLRLLLGLDKRELALRLKLNFITRIIYLKQIPVKRKSI